MKALAALLALTLQSCLATSGDIEDVRGYLDTGLRGVEQAVGALESGQTNIDGAILQIRESGAQTREELAAKVQEIAERGGQIGNAIKENWAEVLMALLVGGAGTVGAAVKATNVVRDGKRIRRGEPVVAPPPTKA